MDLPHLVPLRGSAPSGLTAALAPVDPPLADFDSDEEYHWDGDSYGTEYPPPG